MAYSNNITLSGRQTSSNLLKLSGKVVKNVIPTFVANIQVNIMNNIILPMVNSQWNTLQENLFLVETLRPKLALYYSTYKLPELLVYQNVLTICSNLMNEHLQLTDLEKQHYGSTLNNVTNIVYKTTMINLKPEYALYNMILGVPNFATGESYNPAIIAEIQSLLLVQNVEYNLIKSIIAQKFKK
jgi:hypothetical protein